MEAFLKKRCENNQLFPFPEEGEVVEESPVCLSWLPARDGLEATAVVLDESGREVWRGVTDRNYAVTALLPAGDYRWNVTADGQERGWQRFSIAEHAVRIPRKTAREVFDAIPDRRPRQLFRAEEIPELLRTRQADLEALKRNVRLALEDGLPKRPMYHRDPHAMPGREYLNYVRRYVDRNLIACALAHALLGDGEAAKQGRELLLEVCDWNPEGPCSVLWTYAMDEVGLSMTRCLPTALDLLWDVLSEDERDYVSRTLAIYASQTEERLRGENFCKNPGSSHSGRLPAYLGEAAIALKGSCVPEETLLRWLDYALEIFGGIFPFYGGTDGSWAEGTFYSTSYTRWFLPFLTAVERFSGMALLNRPFYQRYSQFLLHFANPEFENHPFGDGYWCRPMDAEWPGFFAQNPYRVYADRFGPAEAKARRAALASPEHFELHLMDAFLPAGKAPDECLTGEARRAAAFPKGGFVSMQTDLKNTENCLALLARASRFGSVSHQHSDQGSFALFSGGVALVSPSGYFGRRWGSGHHLNWTNCSRAHNTLTVNGKGMETFSWKPVGRILSCGEKDGVFEAVLDLSGAYEELTRWIRTLRMDPAGTVTVHDSVEAAQAAELEWHLHALSAPRAEGDGLTLERKGKRLEIRPLEGLEPGCELRDFFDVDLNDGEPEDYHVTRPPQYHMTWHTKKKTGHEITVLLTVSNA